MRTLSSWMTSSLVGALIAVTPAVAADAPQTQMSVDPWTGAPLGATLWDQTDSPAGAGFASQTFAPVDAVFDCSSGDDFTIPAADVMWSVGSVFTPGTYLFGVGPTPLVDVEFFGDGAGVPGGAVCSYPGLVAGVDFTDAAGTLDITLPSPCVLPAGDYWVTVRAEMDQAVGGQWFWQMRSAQNGSVFAWENPGDGFGTGCTAWTPAGACGAGSPDLLFSLSGAVVPVELQSFDID